MSNKRKGQTGEDLAVACLIAEKYAVVKRNFRTSTGEIDIVATDGDCLIFVEVKARLSDDYGCPAEAVTYAKRRTINKVAAEYIKKFRLFDRPVRFDVVEVFLDTGHVNHIENAFDSYLRY